MKIVDPVGVKPGNGTRWFGKCNCICYVGTDYEGTHNGAVWAIGDTCRCSCYPDNDDNNNANFALALDK